MAWFLLALVAVIVLCVAALALYDVLQKRHAILRNFPVIGHFRYWLEAVGPELRQYIVTDNDEERPFSRDQRRWVYASSKRQNNYAGFGTDNDIESSPGYVVLKHSALPLGPPTGEEAGAGERHEVACAKVLGAARGRARAFRPGSVVNISAMSYGSLSKAAVEAINRGCAIAGALHNTGEGGVSEFHRKGGELVWQIGTGYFGCRDERGGFCVERFCETLGTAPIRAVEIKLSQGAKPGHGGILPAAKLTPEIARIRGVPLGRDVISPPAHSAFNGVDGLLDFVESLADRSGGLPVGIKSAVGEIEFWEELADRMADGSRGVDFVTIDGGEGGTGAAPPAFADHVSLPFNVGFPRVYRVFAERGLADRVVFIGAGRLGLPERALFAMAMGCDLIGVAREAMLAIGCIQAQRCHTDHCPSGVATQNRWLTRGLDPTLKSVRLANYLAALRGEVVALSRACGAEHPALVGIERFELLQENYGSRSAGELLGYAPGWGLPGDEDRRRLVQLRVARDGADGG